MAQETIKRRKRKRGSEMSMKELQQLYRRNELDEKLRPKSLIQTVQFIHIQEQNQSLTAKKRKALGPQGNAVTVLQRAAK